MPARMLAGLCKRCLSRRGLPVTGVMRHAGSKPGNSIQRAPHCARESHMHWDTQLSALTVAIVHLENTGPIINGDNAYRSELATLRKMRGALSRKINGCKHFDVRRPSAGNPGFQCNDCGVYI